MRFDSSVISTSLPAHLANCLRDVDANEICIEGNRVMFCGGVFRFVTNWNVLVPFGFGDLTVNSEAHEIIYRLSFRQWAILTAIVFSILAVVLVFMGVPATPWYVLALPLIFFAAVFSNVAIGILHFRHFLRRCVATAPQVLDDSIAVR